MKRTRKLEMLGVAFTLFALGAFVSACDSNEAATNEFQTVEVQDLYSSVSSELDLSANQQERFGNALHQHDHGDRAPGYLWIVADSLAQTLTDEQKEELLSRTDSYEGFHPFIGLRGVPGGGGYYGFGGLRGIMGGRGEAGADAVIELSDEQRDAIKEIHETFRAEMKDLRDAHRDGTLSDEEFVIALIDLHQVTTDQIDEVLTEEQKAALEEFRLEQEAQFDAFRAQVRAVRDEVLGLTAEESDAFNAILEDQLNEREVLMEQFQSGALTISELRNEIDALRASTEEALQALLTDEQYEIVQIHAALSVRIGMHGHHGRFGNGSGGPGLGSGDGGPSDPRNGGGNKHGQGHQ